MMGHAIYYSLMSAGRESISILATVFAYYSLSVV